MHADETPIRSTCGARKVGSSADSLAICNLPADHDADVHQQVGWIGGVIEWPRDDARPDVAGQDDEDFYVAAARAYCAGWGNYEKAMRDYPVAPSFRAAIDAARAPLLAELAEAGESMYDYQHAATRADEERDRARADRDVAEREMERYRQEAHDLVAELAEAVRERDEARAKVDGGEWQWGSRCAIHPGHGTEWFGPDEQQARDHAGRAGVREVVRRHLGPVEAVGDGSGT